MLQPLLKQMDIILHFVLKYNVLICDWGYCLHLWKETPLYVLFLFCLHDLHIFWNIPSAVLYIVGLFCRFGSLINLAPLELNCVWTPTYGSAIESLVEKFNYRQDSMCVLL